MYDTKTIEGIKKIRDGLDLIIASIENGTDTPKAVAEGTTSERKVATPTAPQRATKKDAPKETTANFSEEDLNSMPYNDLKKLARDLGVSGAGSRDKIVERILGVNLNVDADGGVSVPEKAEEKPVKKSAPKLGAKKTEPEPEPEPEEEEDPIYAQVLELTEEMSLDELGDVLASIGVSPKGKRQALIDKIYNAVKEGKLSLEDDEDEDNGEEEPDEEEVETDEPTDDEDEDDGVNDPDNMTDARKEACEQYEEEIKNDFENGDLSADDMREFCVEFYGDENEDAISDLDGEDLLDVYIDAVKRMIDDEGELVEEGAYEVNGEPFCCGRALQYAEDTGKFICEMCGTEYDAD